MEGSAEGANAEILAALNDFRLAQRDRAAGKIAADVVLFGGAGTFDAHGCETDFEKIRLENHGLA